MHKVTTPATIPQGANLQKLMSQLVASYERLGIDNLLIAQRWWGDGNQIEASSLDCLAMTAYFASITSQINLITAVHPGFFHPTAIAKWGATVSQLSAGRWSINVTSGWNMQEFDMYGIDKLDHDQRYKRSAEFIQVLRGAWTQQPFTFAGEYYTTDKLVLEPKPQFPLQVFQGGQSGAAISMAAQHSDWIFLNGANLDNVTQTVNKIRAACQASNRQVRCALYAAPLCRETDEQAWLEIDQRLGQVDHKLVAARQARIKQGAQGMWSDTDDPLSVLDTNEGYAARLIGSPETIYHRIQQFHQAGIELLHLDMRDELFNTTVLPRIRDM